MTQKRMVILRLGENIGHHGVRQRLKSPSGVGVLGRVGDLGETVD